YFVSGDGYGSNGLAVMVFRTETHGSGIGVKVIFMAANLLHHKAIQAKAPQQMLCQLPTRTRHSIYMFAVAAHVEAHPELGAKHQQQEQEGEENQWHG